MVLMYIHAKRQKYLFNNLSFFKNINQVFTSFCHRYIELSCTEFNVELKMYKKDKLTCILKSKV